ncbi:MAG TPA: hypothetical protein VGL55_16730 [Steroidobacteraceae bacterium]|jgi:cytochrome c-type biogenesis protein CcmH
MMMTFVLLAALLTVGGVALVAVPLLRPLRTQAAPAPWTALAVAGVLVLGSVVLYLTWSNWSWREDTSADGPQTMVARLARKLEREPRDLNGWLMLGRSYTVLQQYPLAVRAYERADRLAGGRNADALLGQAEALSLQDETELDRRAGKLVEQALVLDPDSGKALFFGAAAAMRRGDLPLARARFAHLLRLDPPDNIKPLLQQQIAAIDQQIAAGRGQGPSAQPGSLASSKAGAAQAAAPAAGAAKEAGASGAEPAQRGETNAAGNSAAPSVRIHVTLAPALAKSASADSPLFVFVRDPTRPGPPLAVKRLASRFPQTVELTASDSMMPGRAIAPGQRVEVVARIARSGNPIGASGDPFGQIVYRVGHDGLSNIVIDQVTP